MVRADFGAGGVMGGMGGNPAGEALRFIEHRIGDDIQLAEIGAFSGVSRL